LFNYLGKFQRLADRKWFVLIYKLAMKKHGMKNPQGYFLTITAFKKSD